MINQSFLIYYTRNKAQNLDHLSFKENHKWAYIFNLVFFVKTSLTFLNDLKFIKRFTD
jgi:hypothetical protein